MIKIDKIELNLDRKKIDEFKLKEISAYSYKNKQLVILNGIYQKEVKLKYCVLKINRNLRLLYTNIPENNINNILLHTIRELINLEIIKTTKKIISKTALYYYLSYLKISAIEIQFFFPGKLGKALHENSKYISVKRYDNTSYIQGYAKNANIQVKSYNIDKTCHTNNLYKLEITFKNSFEKNAKIRVNQLRNSANIIKLYQPEIKIILKKTLNKLSNNLLSVLLEITRSETIEDVIIYLLKKHEIKKYLLVGKVNNVLDACYKLYNSSISLQDIQIKLEENKQLKKNKQNYDNNHREQYSPTGQPIQ